MYNKMRRTAIDNFLAIELSEEEMERIFVPETRRVCQTCHKVRLKKKIDRANFTPRHRRFICIGYHPNQNNNQQNQADNLNQNNDVNDQGDNNMNNIGQDNFDAPDNNDNMVIVNANNDIQDIQEGNNNLQYNNQDPNIGNNQNHFLIIQNNNNNNNEQNNNLYFILIFIFN